MYTKHNEIPLWYHQMHLQHPNSQSQPLFTYFFHQLERLDQSSWLGKKLIKERTQLDWQWKGGWVVLANEEEKNDKTTSKKQQKWKISP